MSLTNVGIGRKLAAGFACILIAVAVMNVTLFGLLRAADHAAEANVAFSKTIGDLDGSLLAAAEEWRASSGYVIAKWQDRLTRLGQYLLVRPRRPAQA